MAAGRPQGFLAPLIVFVAALTSCGGSDAKADRVLKTFSPQVAGFMMTSPTVVGGDVYIGTYYWGTGTAINAFYKLDGDLNVMWSYPLGGEQVVGAAALDSGGNVYFTAMNDSLRYPEIPPYPFYSTATLYKLDSTGALEWTHLIDTTSHTYGYTGTNTWDLSPAIGADDTIYVGGDGLHAIRPDGTSAWTYGVSGVTWVQSPAVIDAAGNLYFGTSGFPGGPGLGSAVSVDAAGALRWEVPMHTGQVVNSPAFSVDASKVYFSAGGSLYCLASATGTTVWRYQFPENLLPGFPFPLLVAASPAIDEHDNAYVGASGVFYAIRADGSGLLWSKPLGVFLYSSPALGNDRNLYFGFGGVGGQNVAAVDMATGQTRWTVDLAADVGGSPAIVADGRLYVGAMSIDGKPGNLAVIQTDSTGLLTGTGSSRYRQGNESTGRK